MPRKLRKSRAGSKFHFALTSWLLEQRGLLGPQVNSKGYKYTLEVSHTSSVG